MSTIFERRIPLCKCLRISPSNHSATAYFWKEEKEWMIFLNFISGPDAYQERICKFAAKQRTGKNWDLILIKCRVATPTCTYLWLFVLSKQIIFDQPLFPRDQEQSSYESSRVSSVFSSFGVWYVTQLQKHSNKVKQKHRNTETQKHRNTETQ